MRLLLLLLALPLVACAPRASSSPGDGTDEPDGDPTPAPTPEPTPDPEYGPENSWFHALEADVPEVTSTGMNVGDTPANFTLTDQHGDEVELYQFWGKIVVLDIYAEWCPPCRDNAPHGQKLWLAGDGEIILLATMQEDVDYSPASAEGIARWVEDFELTHPVLADTENVNRAFAGSGFPTYVVIGRDMTILNADLWPFDTEWVLDLIEES